MPLESLYTGDALKPLAISDNEIVREVIVPGQAPLRGSAFVKVTMRGGMEFAALDVAVVLDMEEDGVLCRGARITLGSISSSPIRALKGEKTLARQRLSEELFQEVAQVVASEARPFPHHGYSSKYLRECLRVQTLRALTVASERMKGYREGYE